MVIKYLFKERVLMNKKMIFCLCAAIAMAYAKDDLWDKTKKAVGGAAKKVVKTTKKAATSVAKGTEKVAQKAVEQTSKAVQKVGQTAQTVARKTDEAAQTVVKETKKAVETAVEETGKAAQKVGEFVQEEIIDPMLSSFEKLDAWKLPDGRLRFDQVAYLGAHNAHANQQEGFLYSQQLWSLENQLKHGVRHFLIDIWVGKEGADKGKLVLCHEDCEKKSRPQRAGKKYHVTFKAYLEKIKKFLDTHPKEIVSLELENYASAKETAGVIDSVPGLRNYILTVSDYDPDKNDGKWPTLDWMISKNKRLIIFDTGAVENETYGYGYKTDRHMVRNMYGTHDIDKACQVRGSVRKGSRLYQLNYFGTIASPLPIHNTPEQLKKVLKRCQEKGVFSKGKAPNFVALDNVHLGNAMKWVNELNAKAAQQLK